MASNPDWIRDLLDEQAIQRFGYQERSGMLVQAKCAGDEESVWRESIFAERSIVPFTTSWCEQQLGEDLLDSALGELSDPKKTLFLDLGCGDGRFVKALLERGANKIIALNYEIEPLERLAGTLAPKERSRVALVCEDVNESPFMTQISQFTIAWGLWTSAENFSQALVSSKSLTCIDGLILSADPILEQYLVYALVMQDPVEFVRVLETRTRPVDWDDRDRRYPLKTLNELRAELVNPGLEMLWEKGISTVPSLLFGGLLSKTTYQDEEKEILWESILSSNTQLGWFRQMVYLFRRLS
jgi:SAM-dependent methyltransferase